MPFTRRGGDLTIATPALSKPHRERKQQCRCGEQAWLNPFMKSDWA